MIVTRKITLTIITLLLTIGMCTIFSSCNDDDFSTDPSHILSFSVDTLTFDTIFTATGSATAKIMVYNRNKSALKIGYIGIQSGNNSKFRINVDGPTNNNQYQDIEIAANDSMFIFVDVTVDPTDATSPQLIEDAIVFITNGTTQRITLEAYGQTMIPLRSLLIKNDTTLTSEFPYIVTGYLAIDSAKTLTLAPGCKLYFHNNANLIINGHLKAEGTLEKPIIMRGDRLDKIKFDTPFPYNNVAGQWGGIYLKWKGGNHILKHVNMNSGYVGIYFSNSDRSELPNLEISDCRIHNFLLYGLVVQNGNVTVKNTEISNCSSYCVYLNGGKHSFIHTTIANYFSNSSVQSVSRDKNPAVMIMDLNRIAPMETLFANCIISGTSEDEFKLATRFEDRYKGVFKNTYIRLTKPVVSQQFSNIKWSERNDTIFKSVRYDYKKNNYFDFTLDSVSVARGMADASIIEEYNLQLDLNGHNRLTDNAPDAGAYEWK